MLALQKKDMKDKTIIITGASSGIGAATAKLLGRQGAKVVLAARREDQLKQLATAIGPNATYQVTDVSKPADLDRLITHTIDRHGRIDVLFNNAGVMPISFFDEGRIADWDRMIDINIKGVLYGINAVLPHMLRQKKGHIITTSSVAGLQTGPGIGVYSATKYAVRAIMESLRQELAEYIKVTTLYPGRTDSELADHITSPKVMAHYTVGSPAPMMEAEAIAEAVAYAIGSPGNTNINDIVLRPLGQTR